MSFHDSLNQTNRGHQKEIQKLIKSVASGNNNFVPKQMIAKIKSYASNQQTAQLLMDAIIDSIDTYASHSYQVYKMLFVIETLIKDKSLNFFQTARKYAPDIRLVLLLSFEERNSPLRDQVHRLAYSIYQFLIHSKPLSDNTETTTSQPEHLLASKEKYSSINWIDNDEDDKPIMSNASASQTTISVPESTPAPVHPSPQPLISFDLFNSEPASMKIRSISPEPEDLPLEEEDPFSDFQCTNPFADIIIPESFSVDCVAPPIPDMPVLKFISNGPQALQVHGLIDSNSSSNFMGLSDSITQPAQNSPLTDQSANNMSQSLFDLQTPKSSDPFAINSANDLLDWVSTDQSRQQQIIDPFGPQSTDIQHFDLFDSSKQQSSANGQKDSSTVFGSGVIDPFGVKSQPSQDLDIFGSNKSSSEPKLVDPFGVKSQPSQDLDIFENSKHPSSGSQNILDPFGVSPKPSQDLDIFEPQKPSGEPKVIDPFEMISQQSNDIDVFGSNKSSGETKSVDPFGVNSQNLDIFEPQKSSGGQNILDPFGINPQPSQDLDIFGSDKSSGEPKLVDPFGVNSKDSKGDSFDLFDLAPKPSKGPLPKVIDPFVNSQPSQDLDIFGSNQSSEEPKSVDLFSVNSQSSQDLDIFGSNQSSEDPFGISAPNKQPSSGKQLDPFSSNSQPKVVDDPFSINNKPSPIAADPFSSGPKSAQPKVLDDPFSVNQPPKENQFDLFGMINQSNNSFDPFAPVQQSKPSDPFGDMAPIDMDDPFGVKSQKEQKHHSHKHKTRKPSTAQQETPKAAIDDDGETFDPFEGLRKK